MRRSHPLLRLFLILSVIFVVLGLARGWFYFSKSNEPDDKVNVHFTVDKQKVNEDSAKVKNAAGELGDKVVNETKHLQQKATNHDQPVVPPAPLDQPENPGPQYTVPQNTVPQNAVPQNAVPQNPPGTILK